MKYFNYRWSLKNTLFTRDKGKVFSCFACGGGSTMGYKLAGYDVIGCTDIDPKMIEVYKINHNPKYAFIEPMQTFKNNPHLPDELFNLDILDGSPPCSSFSVSGNRSKDWGKTKKFKEGQAYQILDTLFFDFIDLAKRLQPKIVIAENVKGLLIGEARQYVLQIYREFEKAGYNLQHWLLDASKMGVPQKRERVFFIALRNDLCAPFMYQKNLFDVNPFLKMNFNAPPIFFENIADNTDTIVKNNTVESSYYDLVKIGQKFSHAHPRKFFFNNYKVHPRKPLNTLTTHNRSWHHSIKRLLNNNEIILAGSFPADYNFLKIPPLYLVGMSVPPVMMAGVATGIHDQWLRQINLI